MDLQGEPPHVTGSLGHVAAAELARLQLEFPVMQTTGALTLCGLPVMSGHPWTSCW